MSIVNEIKCARCDRKYSGVRSRCPYCGARRIGRGKYSEDSDNARGKMLISVLIMAVFTVAAGVLLFTSEADAVNPTPEASPEITTPDDNLNILIPPSPPPTIEPQPSPTPVPLEVASVTILYGGNPLYYVDQFTERAGRAIELGVRVDPPGVDDRPEWRIEYNEDEEEFIQLDHVVGGVRLVASRAGRAKLIVSAGDKETFAWAIFN